MPNIIIVPRLFCPLLMAPSSVLHQSQAVIDTSFSGNMNSPTNTPGTRTEEHGKCLHPILQLQLPLPAPHDKRDD